MIEMAGLFIIMGVVVGLISGLNLTRISEAFTKGLRSVNGCNYRRTGRQ